MKLHKEKNDSDTSQVLLDRNQKPVPPVLKVTQDRRKSLPIGRTGSRVLSDEE